MKLASGYHFDMVSWLSYAYNKQKPRGERKSKGVSVSTQIIRRGWVQKDTRIEDRETQSISESQAGSPPGFGNRERDKISFNLNGEQADQQYKY